MVIGHLYCLFCELCLFVSCGFLLIFMYSFIGINDFNLFLITFVAVIFLICCFSLRAERREWERKELSQTLNSYVCLVKSKNIYPHFT